MMPHKFAELPAIPILPVKNLIKAKGIPKAKKECVVLPQEWQAHGLPVPEAHYKFCPGRNWEADYAFKEGKLIIEIEGIFWKPKPGQKSRHQTGKGYEEDTKKYNRAQELGWIVLRYVQGHGGRAKIDWDQVKKIYSQRHQTESEYPAYYFRGIQIDTAPLPKNDAFDETMENKNSWYDSARRK
jgi:hypothetical protein